MTWKCTFDVLITVCFGSDQGWAPCISWKIYCKKSSKLNLNQNIINKLSYLNAGFRHNHNFHFWSYYFLFLHCNISVQVNLCQKLFFLQNMGRTCCVQILVLTFRTIFVHKLFSPCSAKRRASDKDLPVNGLFIKQKYLFYTSCSIFCSSPSQLCLSIRPLK